MLEEKRFENMKKFKGFVYDIIGFDVVNVVVFFLILLMIRISLWLIRFFICCYKIVMV